MMNRLSVSCTRSGVATNSALKAGSAGRLMSMASAVSAVIAPSSATSTRESERIMAKEAVRRSRILEAQHAAVDVVGEELGVAGPIDHRLEDLPRFLLRQIIFELDEEAAFGRAVSRSFVQNPPNVRGERHGGPHVVVEDLLAVLEIGRSKGAARRQNLDVAANDLGQTEKLERFHQHHQIVGRQMLALGELGKVGAAVVRRLRQRLEQAGELL